MFKVFYDIILGDFGKFHDTFGGETGLVFKIQKLSFAFFLLSTFLSMIIMMNLLISVISDVYAKVQSMEKNSKTFEKLQIICSVDTMLSGEKLAKLEEEFDNAYLFIAKKKVSDDDVNSTNQIRSRIENIDKMVF